MGHTQSVYGHISRVVQGEIMYFYAFYLLLRVGLCEFVVLFLVKYNWKHMLTLKYSCTEVVHVLL